MCWFVPTTTKFGRKSLLDDSLRGGGGANEPVGQQ